MPNIQDRFLQAGVNADNYLVGPAVLFLQDDTKWSIAPTVIDGTGFPRYIDDVVNLATGIAVSANGWSYVGYTNNLKQDRNRTFVKHDADQQANIEIVSDKWENMITFDLLEMSPAKLGLFWQGNAGDPIAVTGAPAFAQTQVDFGDPNAIVNRRVALMHVDKLAFGHMFVYRKASIIAAGGPTYTRTGNIVMPIHVDIRPDTRVVNVDARSFRLYHTNVPIT